MKTTKPLIISGLLAAVVIGGLVVYGMNQQPAPSPAPAPAPQPAPAPTPTPAPEPTPAPPAPVTKTYTNATFGFTLDYPENIVPTEDKQDMAMSGYLPVCDPDTAVVCFPYGKELMPGKNFDNAAFSVHVLSKLKTEDKCLALGNGEEADGTATIGGTPYKKFASGDAAMGHQLSGENYRAFRNGNCFQLSTAVFTTTYENYPPGTLERFTDQDRANVQHVLDAMLLSFKFTS